MLNVKNKAKQKGILYSFSVFLFCIIFISSPTYAQQDDIIKIPTQLRFMRIYGGDNETKPPVILIKGEESRFNTSIGEKFVTIEFDVASNVPPSLYARFYHCTFDWIEDENVFLNDVSLLRTSNIEWSSAPMLSKFYNYRGKLKVPNEQIKFNYAGNWKVKIFDYNDESKPFAEGRFFVVQPKTNVDINIFGDFYSPKYSVSSSALTMEASVTGSSNLLENNVHTAVFYRNHRWWEPFYVSSQRKINFNQKQYRYKFPTYISGFITYGKKFRIDRLPAENAYRILNMSNIAEFPAGGDYVRLPLSDIRRRGTFLDRDDDGAMITTFIPYSYDDYVYVEFVLDPDGWTTNEDVVLVGSFNNWKPDKNWIMYYDEEERYFKLRQWVRRARHNYLYGTAKVNIDSDTIENLSYDEFEGNTGTAGHTFIALIYYREIEFGGYDSIIGIGAANIYGNIRR